jgi:hypothetical protein
VQALKQSGQFGPRDDLVSTMLISISWRKWLFLDASGGTEPEGAEQLALEAPRARLSIPSQPVTRIHEVSAAEHRLREIYTILDFWNLPDSGQKFR